MSHMISLMSNYNFDYLMIYFLQGIKMALSPPDKPPCILIIPWRVDRSVYILNKVIHVDIILQHNDSSFVHLCCCMNTPVVAPAKIFSNLRINILSPLFNCHFLADLYSHSFKIFITIWVN